MDCFIQQLLIAHTVSVKNTTYMWSSFVHKNAAGTEQWVMTSQMLCWSLINVQVCNLLQKRQQRSNPLLGQVDNPRDTTFAELTGNQSAREIFPFSEVLEFYQNPTRTRTGSTFECFSSSFKFFEFTESRKQRKQIVNEWIRIWIWSLVCSTCSSNCSSVQPTRSQAKESNEQKGCEKTNRNYTQSKTVVNWSEQNECVAVEANCAAKLNVLQIEAN